MSKTDRTVVTVRSEPLQRFVSTAATAALGGSNPDGGAGMIRVTRTHETRFKKNQTG